jgi:hypothetical protein
MSARGSKLSLRKPEDGPHVKPASAPQQAAPNAKASQHGGVGICSSDGSEDGGSKKKHKPDPELKPVERRDSGRARAAKPRASLQDLSDSDDEEFSPPKKSATKKSAKRPSGKGAHRVGAAPLGKIHLRANKITWPVCVPVGDDSASDFQASEDDDDDSSEDDGSSGSEYGAESGSQAWGRSVRQAEPPLFASNLPLHSPPPPPPLASLQMKSRSSRCPRRRRLRRCNWPLGGALPLRSAVPGRPSRRRPPSAPVLLRPDPQLA